MSSCFHDPVDARFRCQLVIIIDELDRCRPSFAIEILEKIKHLFSVPNIVFLLVINKSQLEETIKHIYGKNIDAHSYLQKFINVETTIPKRIKSAYHQGDLSIYSKELLKLHELDIGKDRESLLKAVDALTKHFSCTLRQLEKIFTNIAIIYSASNENDIRLTPIIAFICTIKVMKPTLFKSLLFHEISYQEIENNVFEHKPIGDNTFLERTMEWVRFATLTEEEYSGIDDKTYMNSMGSMLWKYNLNRTDIFPYFCQKLCMFSIN